MCVKVAYASPAQAKAALRTLQRKTRKSEFDKAHPYRCERCKRWHLGHRWDT